MNWDLFSSATTFKMDLMQELIRNEGLWGLPESIWFPNLLAEKTGEKS